MTAPLQRWIIERHDDTGEFREFEGDEPALVKELERLETDFGVGGFNVWLLPPPRVFHARRSVEIVEEGK